MVSRDRIEQAGCGALVEAPPALLLSDECRVTKLIDWSRIHWRAFSRFPAAIRFELDWLLASALDPSLPKDEAVEWWDEDEDDCRPQRAGLSDARNEVVLEDAPEKRDRELDDDGVFRPEEDPRVVALLISSCMTEDVVDDEPAGVDAIAWDEEPAAAAAAAASS